MGIMQLPRGTFKEIQRGKKIGDLLYALEKEKFSGVCAISSPDLGGEVVFRQGKCILASCLDKKGDAALDAMHSRPDEEVDAALSLLDEAQLKLALEFNKSWRILRALGTPAPAASGAAHVKKAVPAAAAHAAPAAHTPSVRHVPAAPPAAPRTAPSVFSPASPQQKAAPAATPPHPVRKAPREEEPVAPPVAGSSSFEDDIDTFDAMDLESVTDKIRNDCKTMVKQLHLDHLLER